MMRRLSIALPIFLMAVTRAYGQSAATSNCPGGLMGGPFLSDAQAAQAVQPSSLGGSPAANSHLPTPGELAAFHSAWSANSPLQRVDGQCNLGANPSTADVLQWAALKWGISPTLAYSEANQESHWNQNAVGDNGGSHGIFQVADRPANRPGGANHYYPGLLNSNLAQESTCFNADMWGAWVASTYAGLHTGMGEPGGNEATAIQSWFQHGASVPASYSQKVCAGIGKNPQIVTGGQNGGLQQLTGQFGSAVAPTQWQGSTPFNPQDDPCVVNPNDIPNFAGIGGGGGWPVSDAETEANTANIATQAAGIQQNTDVLAQLAYQHCEAEEQAWRTDVQTVTGPSSWDNSNVQGTDPQAPAP